MGMVLNFLLRRMLILGLFTRDYESAGVGISKNAPKKTGIRLFFEILGRKFWKLLEVNILYFLFYVPLVLAGVALIRISDAKIALIVSLLLILIFAIVVGPATAGMTRVMRNYVLEKHSFIIADFFKAFRENFFKAAVIGFADTIICISIYASLTTYPYLADKTDNNLFYVLMIFSFSIAIVVAMMNFYAFLMIIATDLSLKNLLKNSFALAFVELKKSFLTFIIVLVILVGFSLLPLYVSLTFLLLLPFFPAAFVSFIICFNSYPVIQKYVINPYYTSIGQVNPELCNGDPDDDEEPIFEDMGGKEKPIEKRKKGKGRRIS